MPKYVSTEQTDAAFVLAATAVEIIRCIRCGDDPGKMLGILAAAVDKRGHVAFGVHLLQPSVRGQA